MALGVRYLEERKLKGGVTYVYNPPRDAKEAKVLEVQTLGQDAKAAKAQAEKLNLKLDKWRRGELTEAKEPKDTSPRMEKGTFGWLVSEFYTSLEFRSRKKSTQSHYRVILKYVLQYVYDGYLMKDLPLEKLTKRVAKTMYMDLQEQRGPRLAVMGIAIARRAWNVAIANDQTNLINPFAFVPMEIPAPREVVWTYEEMEVFIKAAQERDHASVALAMMLCFELIQRPGDMIRLPWSHYNGREVFVHQSKRGAKVWVPVSPELKAMLDATPKRGIQIVINEKTGQPYSCARRLATAAKLIRRAVGLDETLQIRDLRRTGATEAGDAGATDDELMAIGGWKSRGVLGVYNKVTIAKARQGMEKRWAYRNRKKEDEAV